jgi:hypothetical protein
VPEREHVVEDSLGQWLSPRPIGRALALLRALGYSASTADVKTTPRRESQVDPVTKLIEWESSWKGEGGTVEVEEHERLVETPRMHDTMWGCIVRVQLVDGVSLVCEQHGGYCCRGPSRDRVEEVASAWKALAS